MYRNVREKQTVVGFQFVESVTSVYFPELENTHVDCVLRAAERTAHAQDAVVPEFIFAAFDFYVVLRAYVDAFAAVDAFFWVNL